MPSSTYYRLKSKMKKSVRCNIQDENQKNSILESACCSIAKIVSPPKPPLIITQIKEELLADSEINLRRNMIVKILKDKLNYSLKRVVQDQLRVQKQELTWLRELFSIKALKYILEEKTIVNIDETCFNRSLKTEYSWLPKNLTSSIININSYGRCSLVLATLTDGSWFGMIEVDTINWKDFSNFIKTIVLNLKLRNIDVNINLIYTLDNATTHHWKDATKVFNNLHLNVLFIPAYTLTLAHIELVFKALKCKIKAYTKSKIINYSKNEERKWLQMYWTNYQPDLSKRLGRYLLGNQSN